MTGLYATWRTQSYVRGKWTDVQYRQPIVAFIGNGGGQVLAVVLWKGRLETHDLHSLWDVSDDPTPVEELRKPARRARKTAA